MTPDLLAWAVLVLAAIPAALLVLNLFSYRPLPLRRRSADAPPPNRTAGVSVLIPARNEAHAIGPALTAVLAHQDPDVELEVIVLDDHSTDQTAEQVRDVSRRDPRVRLIQGQPLPDGWCGKQHACWQLAQAARQELLLFVDADVRLTPQTLTRMVAFMERHPRVQLASGVPRQRTGTLMERLLIPLIHTVLLGYLPIVAARRFPWSAFAAGCGQLFLARRPAYFAAGGHQAIRHSLHDGVTLPRAFRRRGLITDLFDATDVATCRMYASAGEVWRGLGKNATEGLAHPVAILPWTLLLLGGHVLPWILLALGPWPPHPVGLCLVLAAGLPLATRLLSAAHFRQSWIGALLHPLGVLLLVGIQWQALARRWRGRPLEWRGRQYPGHSTPPLQPRETVPS